MALTEKVREAWREPWLEKKIYAELAGKERAKVDVATVALGVTSRATALILAGVASGGISLPAAMAAANGLKQVSEASAEIPSAYKMKKILDRALVGSLDEKHVRVSKRTRQTLKRVFGEDNLFKIWEREGPNALQVLSERHFHTLRSQRDESVPPAKRTIGPRAYNESYTALTTIALNDWAKKRIVPHIPEEARQESHVKTLRKLKSSGRTEFWRKLDENLSPHEKEVYHKTWLARLGAKKTLAANLAKMMGGFIAVGAASWAEGKFGAASKPVEVNAELSRIAHDLRGAADEISKLEVRPTGSTTALHGLELRTQGLVNDVPKSLLNRIDAELGISFDASAIPHSENIGMLVNYVSLRGYPTEVALGYAISKAGAQKVAEYLRQAASHLDSLGRAAATGSALKAEQLAALPSVLPLVQALKKREEASHNLSEKLRQDT